MFLEQKERILGIQCVGNQVWEFGPRQGLFRSGPCLVLREYGPGLVLWQIGMEVFPC